MNFINLDGHKITFEKKYSTRARTIRISIDNSGKLILTIPKVGFLQSKASVEKKAFAFLESKKNWILKHISSPNMKLQKNLDLKTYSREHYLKYKEQARELCEQKCKFWAEKMGVKYNRIAIKSMKTKWGSCSSKKNLNFNYKILFLSKEDQDYLIVHELSHLVHMNHSDNFWELLCKTLGSPKYKKYKIGHF